MELAYQGGLEGVGREATDGDDVVRGRGVGYDVAFEGWATLVEGCEQRPEFEDFAARNGVVAAVGSDEPRAGARLLAVQQGHVELEEDGCRGEEIGRHQGGLWERRGLTLRERSMRHP